MENQHEQQNKYPVYPGEYVLLPEFEMMLRKVPSDIESWADVKMAENKDAFDLQIDLPGSERSDIFISVHDNTLRLVSIHKNRSQPYASRHAGVGYKTLVKDIALPFPADAEFAHAEYTRGIVKITIPKTSKTCCTDVDHIVIY
jgi:HSP20 family molecular chaperone IbpA